MRQPVKESYHVIHSGALAVHYGDQSTHLAGIGYIQVHVLQRAR